MEFHNSKGSDGSKCFTYVAKTIANSTTYRLLFETNVTKVISKNVLEKSSEKTLFFYLILPEYVVHESSKEF